VLALGVTIIVLPFTSGFPLTDDPYPHLRGIPLADIAAALLVIAVAPLAVRRARSRDLGVAVVLWTLVTAVMVVSFGIHPSILGAQILLRMAGVAAAAVAVGSLASHERVLVLASLSAVALAEVVIAWLQIAVGQPLGIPGEVPAPFELRGTVPLPRGTLWHGYVLAALGMTCAGLVLRHGLASRTWIPWIVVAGLTIQPVGMSESRGVLLGFVAAVAALWWAARSSTRYRWAILALVLGAAIPAAILRDGWLWKATPEQILYSDDRVTMLEQSSALIAEKSFFGVGPGNYKAAARALMPDAKFIQPVHDLPLLLMAEGGVLAGALAIVLLAALAASAWRGGPDAIALLFLFLFFTIFDSHPYVTAQGAVLLGMWIGGIDATGWSVRDLRSLVDTRAWRRGARTSRPEPAART
jgi:hypothetical protein